ncbi:hypothetical protein ACOMHN_047015 [Nucella lapillus]
MQPTRHERAPASVEAKVVSSTNGDLQTADDPTAVHSNTPITAQPDVEMVDETKCCFFRRRKKKKGRHA